MKNIAELFLGWFLRLFTNIVFAIVLHWFLSLFGFSLDSAMLFIGMCIIDIEVSFSIANRLKVKQLQ